MGNPRGLLVLIKEEGGSTGLPTNGWRFLSQRLLSEKGSPCNTQRMVEGVFAISSPCCRRRRIALQPMDIARSFTGRLGTSPGRTALGAPRRKER